MIYHRPNSRILRQRDFQRKNESFIRGLWLGSRHYFSGVVYGIGIVIIAGFAAKCAIPFYFPYHLKDGNLVLYSERPIPKSYLKLSQDVKNELRLSPYYNEQVPLQIHLCASKRRFGLFRYFAADAAGYYRMDINAIFVDHNEIDGRHDLKNVVVHEATHAMLRHRLGILRFYFLPKWLSEGYCEYVAHQKPDVYGKNMMIYSLNCLDPCDSFESYQRYHLLVVHALEKMSPEQLFHDPPRQRDLEKELGLQSKWTSYLR